MALTFSGCVYYDEPYANISVSDDVVEPYEVVYFDSYSSDADDFYWDFGDGYTSHSPNPEHSYDVEGIYTVSLTVTNHHGGEDVAYIDITVGYTDLRITVAEWNSDFDPSVRVSNAEVTLYTSYDDWYNRVNPFETKYTDSRGVVLFTNLEPIRYFIDVYRSDYDNSLLGQEDISYIETDMLHAAELNTFTAWVDYYPPTMQQSTKEIRLNYKAAHEKRVYKKVESDK